VENSLSERRLQFKVTLSRTARYVHRPSQPLDLVTTTVEYKLPLRNFFRLKDTAGNILDTKQVWLRHLDSHSYKRARKNWISFPFYIIISRATRSSQLQLFPRPQFWFLRRAIWTPLQQTAKVRAHRIIQDGGKLSTEIFQSCDLTQQNYTSALKLVIKMVITHWISSGPKAETKTLQGRHYYKRKRTTMRHHTHLAPHAPPKIIIIIISWYMVTSCTNPF
jgi:hypothetical protein